MGKIAIDEGHGLYTSGKRCLKSLDPKQTREWVLNHRVGAAVVKYLKSAGHSVLMVSDPTGKEDVPLSVRVNRANDWDADFYMSIHHDFGVGGGTGGGTTVFVYDKLSKTSKSPKYQEAIYKHAIENGDLKGNRADGTRSANFYVLRETNMPACLIECGFMDSKTDIKYILDSEWSNKMGLGIAKGICEIAGGKVKIEEEKPVVKKEETFKNGSYNKEVKTTANLRVRADRGAEFDTLGTLKKGTVVKVLYILKASDGRYWGSIDYGKDVGYICLDYVEAV